MLDVTVVAAPDTDRGTKRSTGWPAAGGCDGRISAGATAAVALVSRTDPAGAATNPRWTPLCGDRAPRPRCGEACIDGATTPFPPAAAGEEVMDMAPLKRTVDTMLGRTRCENVMIVGLLAKFRVRGNGA